MGRYIRKFFKIFFTVGFVMVGMMLLALVIAIAVRSMGKKSIRSAGAVDSPQLSMNEGMPEGYSGPLTWQDDWIIYHRGIYDYNDDIMTFLIMGIDKSDAEVSKVYGEINGGQADALFLLVINPRDESVRIIGINRNTMTDVDIYDEYGNYVTTRTAQIAVQHGFGDGMEQSCELQKKAVEKLFHSLPIHGYAAVNMSAVPAINDAVGGVDITPRQSFTGGGYSFTENETVHLEGEMAYVYLHDRDVTRAGSADLRQQRHKDYLLAYIKKAKETVKKNPLLVMDIYKSIEKQMTTDLSAKEIFYLSTKAMGYSFDKGSFYMPEGTTSVGDAFEEFYVDDDALIELMLDVFYEKVGEY